MSKGVKKAGRIVIIVFSGIVLLLAASFLPTIRLDSGSMHRLEDSWITLYYEKQEAAAMDVFDLAESEAGRLTQKLGFAQKQDLKLYLYDRQSTFQAKKYGLLALLLNLDWYIGDNRGTAVILASPGEASTQNEYSRRKNAAPHEMVHALNSILNPEMSLWLNEGAALYLTNGSPRKDLYDHSPVPTLSQMDTANPVAFADMGGYDFAHTYIEYLDKAYGWNSVLALLKTGDFLSATGKPKETLYEEWKVYLKANYSAARQ